jgi:DNA-binding PadR family transcriptional regulator
VFVLCAIRDLDPRYCYAGPIEEYVNKISPEPVPLVTIYIILKRLRSAKLLRCGQRKSPISPAHKVIAYSLTAQGRQTLARLAPLYAAAARATLLN